RRVNKYTSEKITTGILPDPSNPLTVTYTAGHRRGTEVFGTHKTAGREWSTLYPKVTQSAANAMATRYQHLTPDLRRDIAHQVGRLLWADS
ncbi:MAG: hypothetical protein M3460_29240, partial [Actinomycetota bacterium]|nr:hypothetical protein [Actinomycetota bacterium]